MKTPKSSNNIPPRNKKTKFRQVPNILLNPMDLSVYSTNDLKLFENRKRNTVSGYLNLDKEEIFLEKKLTPTMTSVVLMHEILHAILYRGGVVDQDEKIETMIEILSYGIIEVLKKNPKFVSYILKEKKE